MPYEYAVYFKLLLLLGDRDELNRYIENALIEQNSLSDIVLELSMVESSDKKILSVLNEYLLQIDDSEIDYDETVFDLVVTYLRKKYYDEAMPMKKVIGLMRQFVRHLKDRAYVEPWSGIYQLELLYEDVEMGWIDDKQYRRQFEAFINDKDYCEDGFHRKPNDSFWKRLIAKTRGNK